MKRIGYVLGVVAVIALVLGLGYYLRFREKPSGGPGTGGITGTTGNLPVGELTGRARIPNPGDIPPAGIAGGQLGAQEQVFGVVSDVPALAYHVSEKGVVTIIQPNGEVVRVANGQKSSLSGTTISDVHYASFSKDGERALIVFGSREVPQASVFDVTSKSWKPLPKDVKNPVWSPDENDHRIVYLAERNDAVELMTLDLAQSAATPRSHVRVHGLDLGLSWPNADTVFLSERPSVWHQGSIWRWSFRARTLTPHILDQQGLISKWSDVPGLGLVFYANQNEQGGILNLIEEGIGTRRFSFVTLPSKCAFGKETLPGGSTSSPDIVPFLVCAIPKNERQISTKEMPDDYLKKTAYTIDDFFSIDMSGGGLTPLFVQEEFALDAEEVNIVGDTAFFVNRYDQKLYALSLASRNPQ